MVSINDSSPAVIHEDNDKVKEIRTLIENIRIVLANMKEEVQSSNLIPKGLFQTLFNELESLNTALNPERMHVCYVIGGTCAGKSSLINAIINEDKCNVSDTEDAGTVKFEIIPAPEVNTLFVDTVGFGSKLDDSALIKKFKTELRSDGLPDSILLVVTQEQLRNRESLRTTINYVNKVVKRVKSERHNISVPIICVLNKIDQYFPKGLSDSEDCRKEIGERVKSTLEIVNQFLETKATQCIVTSPHKDFGIDQLRSSINAQSPLNAQIADKDLDYMRKHRWRIANKIIGAFSAVSAAASFLPVVDIPVVTIVQEWMYKMLACFSIDSSRTPDTYKTVHRALQTSSLVIRVGALAVGGVFQLSIIGYLVGTSICVAAAASSTAALGWACYYYFVGEITPEEHQE